MKYSHFTTLCSKTGWSSWKSPKGDGVGSFIRYIQQFSAKLIVVTFKDKFIKIWVSLHKLKPWVQKIIY